MRTSPPIDTLTTARAAHLSARQHQLATLTEVNIDDLLSGLGLGDVRRLRPLLRGACRALARRFARQVIAYDDRVGAEGLRAGGAWAVRHFTRDLQIVGHEQIPASGPVLIVANHPGLSDTVALFAAIERRDLRIVAARRPFLDTLPHTLCHLIAIDDAPRSRRAAIRSVGRHLRAGGAVLTFPAGRIEPDPAALPGAIESLDHWSDSVDLFGRIAGNVTVVPAIVSGVLSPRALRHPLTRLRRAPRDREWLAALLQIQISAYQRNTVRVAFGQPITPESSGDEPLGERVKAEVRRLIAQVVPC